MIEKRRVTNLEEESIKKEANGREEESEERKKVEILIDRVRFMVKVNGIESVNEIHGNDYLFIYRESEKQMNEEERKRRER
jgi:hypothetical protein